jgi:glucose/arabinose dehydrogenase
MLIGPQSAGIETVPSAAALIDDSDDDNDGVADVAEPDCGGNPTNPNVRPERTDDSFAGKDDDGDTLVDEALPPAATGLDCDGDGYKGSAEDHVFSPAARGDQDACGSSRWPADLVGSGLSANKLTIQDIGSYVVPIRYINTDVGTHAGDVRWDVVPGTTFGDFDINVADLASVSMVYPPMYGMTRAFNGRICPWPISPGQYELAAAIPGVAYDRMIDFAMVPGSTDEAILALQKDEVIWRISLTNAFAPTLFGNLTTFAGGGGNEEGLLSVAFSPDYANDGRVYVYYTRGFPNPNVLSRFQVVGGVMDTNSPSDETVILSIPDTVGNNHNGGKIQFGNDGYLYLSTGDGGGGGDPGENGQDPDELLGKVLRINVTGVTAPPYYTSPADNPYVGVAGRDEVFAIGFRNPYRMSIDSYTGDVWLGDVGQGAWEEVDRVVKGQNYGWDCYEGNASYESTGCGPMGSYTFPRAVYPNPSMGQAVSGGFVYRGPSMPELNGYFIYADFYSGRIWAVNTLDSSPEIQLIDTAFNISSFAELPDGDLLVLTFNNAIYRLRRL